MGVYRMIINFLVNYVDGGWSPTDTRLGGTEESVVRWAEDLIKRGHGVNVYRNGGRSTVHNGVFYSDRGLYAGGGDITINIKSPEVEPLEPTLYFTNETDAGEKDLSKYLAVIWPSQWAEESIPVNNSRRFILPHGYDPKEIYPGEKITKQCLYASSPDRGLETLLRAWPKVYAAHPDATLKVTYGAPEYDFPGVEFMGVVDEETMNQLYRESDVWCHPANGGELFCITGIKAQAAGCVPVIIPTMALTETVRHGYISDERDYADTLIKVLGEPSDRTKIRESLAKESYMTWGDSTTRLLEIIASVLR